MNCPYCGAIFTRQQPGNALAAEILTAHPAAQQPQWMRDYLQYPQWQQFRNPDAPPAPWPPDLTGPELSAYLGPVGGLPNDDEEFGIL